MINLGYVALGLARLSITRHRLCCRVVSGALTKSMVRVETASREMVRALPALCPMIFESVVGNFLSIRSELWGTVSSISYLSGLN
jgi:hypothetical protein